ncbi:magnesium transporter [Vibrio pectenicida]|uniref:magnesium transporter n=1 Tax=Vibrio pectenicida TaxID=62763 RepID=UPI003B9D3B78
MSAINQTASAINQTASAINKKNQLFNIYFSDDNQALKQSFSDFISSIKSRSALELRSFFQAENIHQSLIFVEHLPIHMYRELISIPNFEFANDIQASPILNRLVLTSQCLLNKNITVEEALNSIKNSADDVLYITVIDDDGCYYGLIKLSTLLSLASCVKLYDVSMEVPFSYLNVDQEIAVTTLQSSPYEVLPILTTSDKPIGLLSPKTAMEIITEEQTEDMELLMGIQQYSNRDDYQELSVMEHVKKRIFWIISLAILGVLSGFIIHSYEDTIAAFTILALYMPMIADSGGNAGSQSATVIVRALALDNIKTRDWISVLWKETRIATILGAVLFAIAFVKIVFFSHGVDLPNNISLALLATAISLAIFFQIISSVIVGAMLPMLSMYLNKDPAIVASPAITTIVDISGLLIYFFFTTRLLGLS